MNDLKSAMAIATSGLKSQSYRMKIVVQNIANSESTAASPDKDPYTRKLVRFENILDRNLQGEIVRPGRLKLDKSPFILRYEPNHPAADDKGYVKYPNVNNLIELGDMREAQISYQANLNMVTTTRQMIANTIDLLKS